MGYLWRKESAVESVSLGPYNVQLHSLTQSSLGFPILKLVSSTWQHNGGATQHHPQESKFKHKAIISEDQTFGFIKQLYVAILINLVNGNVFL